MTNDWHTWHDRYTDPTSSLSARLRAVRFELDAALHRAADGPLRVLSLCAGQGHDVIGCLAGHDRVGDVEALLVEADPWNVAAARRAAAAAGLDGVRVALDDAGDAAASAGAVPADIVLACGIFGNVTDGDVERMIGLLPTLCASGAAVLWTRHRFDPDLTPAIRDRFRDVGFRETGFVSPGPGSWSVGSARLLVPPPDFDPSESLFRFASGPRVRAADDADLDRIREIEVAAGRLFAEIGMHEIAEDPPPSSAELREAMGRGDLIVADDENEPAGYVGLARADGCTHVEQLSVDPAHGRRGLGRVLLAAAATEARRRGHDALTLTTFRDVPWNAPYYERCGFRPLGDDEIGPELRAIQTAEASRGLDPSARVAMRFDRVA